jgi:nicotinamide phosphoribosyltransferase
MRRNDFHNIIINTDSYKQCHYALYPPRTQYVSSYVEARGGEFPAVMFVGLQAFLREYLAHPVTLEDIDEAEDISRGQGMHFNRDNWLGLLRDHGGYLPVEIEAVPEGTVVPTKNVLLQIINTDPKYWWATSFFETSMLRAIWYPATVGTIAWMAKQQVRDVLTATSDRPELLRRILHDYGARGVSSQESAALGGLASLVNFSQTDTIAGIVAARRYYNAAETGFSGPNTEHSTIMAWGRDKEADAIRNALKTYAPNGCAIVLTDTYDHEYCVRNIIAKELKEEVQNFPGMVGVRPDSGDPVQVTSDTVEWLMEAFGYSVNSKGFKVLPDFVRVIQGDGINRASLPQVFIEMERRGLAVDNAAFGMGGGLLQHCNRDTLEFGMKANAVCVDGEWREIAKAPRYDTMKHSKAGRLALVYRDGDYQTVSRDSVAPEENRLVTVFRDGQLVRKWDFSELIVNSERPVPAYYYRDAIAGMVAARSAHAAAPVAV